MLKWYDRETPQPLEPGNLLSQAHTVHIKRCLSSQKWMEGEWEQHRHKCRVRMLGNCCATKKWPKHKQTHKLMSLELSQIWRTTMTTTYGDWQVVVKRTPLVCGSHMCTEASSFFEFLVIREVPTQATLRHGLTYFAMFTQLVPNSQAIKITQCGQANEWIKKLYCVYMCQT